MVKREDVEALLRELREANQWRKHQCVWGPSAAFVRDHMERIEELARTWLAVDGAPVGVVRQVEGPYRDERVLIKCDAKGVRIGQRVKLALVPEAGGGEG